MKYWLLKSDPEEYSWENLKNEKNRTISWDGIRNYQARNYLREMKKEDLAFFYHSSTSPQTIEGIVKIVREVYPDPAQFDPENDYYDPKSDESDPIWDMIDIRYVRDLKSPLPRDEMKKHPVLKNMVLFRNSRLSVQPVSEKEWKIILSLSENK
ncbi:MAG: EVE domain-containing protein [Calditrichaeota bacterium]|nr:EVE domain-containing protein [Calditrichota bacterium]